MNGNAVGNKPGKSGFTLIELLVVIAIIAILAAILFPVFAQARQKARETTSLSNEKQLGLAFIQYLQDNDETYPVEEIFGFNSYGSWCTSILPYLKDLAVFTAPEDTGPTSPSAVPSWGAWISYGVNGWQGSTILPTGNASNFSYGPVALSDCWAVSPSACGGNPGGAVPVIDAKIGEPASSILLAEKFSEDEKYYGDNFVQDIQAGDDWPVNMFLGSQSYSAWGCNIPNDVGSTPTQPFPYGLIGAVSSHYSGTERTNSAMAMFCFCDGHVKAMHPADTNPTIATLIAPNQETSAPTTNMWNALRP